MTFFAFPSSQKPQFYFSNKKNAVIFFVNNFLFSKNVKIQFLINIIKFAFPHTFIYFLIKTILTREKRLPHKISDAIDDIREFIKTNRELFLLNSEKIEEINFIIRNSKWQRRNDKLAIILFKNFDKHPFAVAKAGSVQHKSSIELEFSNTKTVYDKFKNSKSILIPEPIAFHISDKSALYFERAVEGMPFNDYLKLLSGKRRKDIYIDVLRNCKEQLVVFNCQEQFLSLEDFHKYFYNPLEVFSKTELGKRHSLKLKILKAQIDEILESKLISVWMHGDLWAGSILYNGKQAAIIDWEFFSRRGVPLWDFFLLVFYFGAVFNYFTDQDISEIVDNSLLDLATHCKIDKNYIPIIFQSYLLFNVQNRDTDKEKYWQNLLEHYWNVSDSKRSTNKLL